MPKCLLHKLEDRSSIPSTERADEKKLIIAFWPWILTIQLTLEQYGETLKGKHIYLKLMKVEKRYVYALHMRLQDSLGESALSLYHVGSRGSNVLQQTWQQVLLALSSLQCVRFVKNRWHSHKHPASLFSIPFSFNVSLDFSSRWCRPQWELPFTFPMICFGNQDPSGDSDWFFCFQRSPSLIESGNWLLEES
ncbi:hypothetical protein STEG23_022657 [Scotinomys teguina]